MTSPEAIIARRHDEHGDWAEQSALAQDLKDRVRIQVERANSRRLTARQQEAIEMILVKVSRICCGNPNLEDHWDDLAGYALLGKSGHE